MFVHDHELGPEAATIIKYVYVFVNADEYDKISIHIGVSMCTDHLKNVSVKTNLNQK